MLATQLRAFVVLVGGNLHDALHLFTTAGRAYARCHDHDIELAVLLLQQTASLEQTLRCDSILGTHRNRQARLIPRSALGLGPKSPWRVRLAIDDAWLFALDGDAIVAYAKAREARLVSPTAAWEVWGIASLAAIASLFGERVAARTFAEDGWTLAREVDWNETVDDERFGLFQLSEVFATFDALRAEQLLRTFDAIRTPLTGTRVLSFGLDARLRGWDAFVRGSVAHSLGDEARSGTYYAAALEAFRSCKYRWREALTLFAIAGLPLSNQSAVVDAPLEQAIAMVQQHVPNSFLARRIEGWRRLSLDPCGSRLSPAQRDVLRLVLEGHSLRAIASAKGRDYQTIKSHARAVHRAFGTRDNHQLVAECTRRGIVPPLPYRLPEQSSSALGLKVAREQ
ncbi:MAG: hypothetical protein JOZ86_10015 [Candidatus Eremiobacteraeota bacterium]|nr:hypothetical protein [Candidatus Eremiobacteraeota bacterium]